MESDKPANRNKLKERLRTIVGTGASTIVLATTILGAIPAGADVADSSPGDSLKQRVEKVRPQAQDANANLQQRVIRKSSSRGGAIGATADGADGVGRTGTTGTTGATGKNRRSRAG